MPRRRGSRNLVEIPGHVMEQLKTKSKTPGALAQLSRMAGLPDTYLYRSGHGEGTHMNQDYLERVQRALDGHGSSPTPALLRQAKSPRSHRKHIKRGKGRALVHGRQVQAEVQTLPLPPGALLNGREAGLRGVLDGLAIGVQMACRTVSDYLDASGNGYKRG